MDSFSLSVGYTGYLLHRTDLILVKQQFLAIYPALPRFFLSNTLQVLASHTGLDSNSGRSYRAIGRYNRPYRARTGIPTGITGRHPGMTGHPAPEQQF
jgi:hypothetical protein